MNHIDYMIEEMAQRFLYEGNEALYGSEKWQSKAIELVKEKINDSSFIIDENTPVEVLALLEDNDSISNEHEEPEFEFIEGFPVASNNKPEQIQVNELKADIKEPEANKGYVSEMFTDEFIEGLKNKEINLIGSETGSGKTTAIMKRLVPFAKNYNKNVLLLINRTTLRKQLKNEYAKGLEDKPLIKISDTLTIGMYQSINAKISFDIPVSNLIESKFDYVVLDEFHSLYDNSEYDYKSYLFMNYLNEIESTIIALTGTPDNIVEMQEFLNKPINSLREPDKTNNKVENIYIADNTDKYRKVQKNHLENDCKILELNSNIENITKAKNDFRDYKANGLISQSNKYYWKLRNESDEDIRMAIIEHEKMNCNVLATTKFMDVGINIQADTNFLVSYNCTEIPNTIDQYRSRVRFNKDSDYHVDLLFRVLTKQSMYMKMKKIKDEFNYYNDKIKKYGSFENMMKHNPKNNPEGFKDSKKVDDWERFNPVRMKFLRTKYNFLKKLYYSKNIIETYTQMLQEMYPKAVIKVIEYTNLFDIEGYLEGYLKGFNEVQLIKKQQEQIKNDLTALKLDKKHPNNVFGLKRIKDYFKDNHIQFEISRDRATIDGKQQSVWILKRVL